MTLKRAPGVLIKAPVTLAINVPVALLRRPVYSKDGGWRYATMPHRGSKDAADTAVVMTELRELGVPFGNIDRKKLGFCYGGMCYQTEHQVDESHQVVDPVPSDPAKNGKNPMIAVKIDEKTISIPIVPRQKLTWGGIMVSTAVAVFSLSQNYIGIPLKLVQSLGYLAINAVENALSDLVPKHGFNPKTWLRNLGHIKMKKLTEAGLSTAIAYPFLSSMKNNVHIGLGLGVGTEMALVALAATAIDMFIVFATRLWRGFPKGVAKWDMLRPVVGNVLASLTFLIAGLDFSQHIKYFFICKIFNACWSGPLVGLYQYWKKRDDRVDELKRIIYLDNPQLRDPIGQAALDLAHNLYEKPRARDHFEKALANGHIDGIPIFPPLTKIAQAMTDETRIKAAIEFAFPGSDEAEIYRRTALNFFTVHKRAFWLRYCPIIPLSKDQFSRRGISVIGLENIPEIMREDMAAAAERFGLTNLVVESPLAVLEPQPRN
jgi:hypothetical protein